MTRTMPVWDPTASIPSDKKRTAAVYTWKCESGGGGRVATGAINEPSTAERSSTRGGDPPLTARIVPSGLNARAPTLKSRRTSGEPARASAEVPVREQIRFGRTVDPQREVAPVGREIDADVSVVLCVR